MSFCYRFFCSFSFCLLFFLVCPMRELHFTCENKFIIIKAPLLWAKIETNISTKECNNYNRTYIVFTMKILHWKRTVLWLIVHKVITKVLFREPNLMGSVATNRFGRLPHLRKLLNGVFTRRVNLWPPTTSIIRLALATPQ